MQSIVSLWPRILIVCGLRRGLPWQSYLQLVLHTIYNAIQCQSHNNSKVACLCIRAGPHLVSPCQALLKYNDLATYSPHPHQHCSEHILQLISNGIPASQPDVFQQRCGYLISCLQMLTSSSMAWNDSCTWLEEKNFWLNQQLRTHQYLRGYEGSTR